MYNFSWAIIAGFPLMVQAAPASTNKNLQWNRLPTSIGFALDSKKYDKNNLHIIRQFPVIGDKLYTYTGSTNNKLSFIPFPMEELVITTKFDSINSLILKFQVKDLMSFKKWFSTAFNGPVNIQGSDYSFEFPDSTISANCNSNADSTVIIMIKSKTIIAPTSINSARDAFNRFESCVASVNSYDPSGKLISTGSGIATGFGVITNFHVIDAAHSVEVKINENSYKINQILKHKSLDLALLHFNGDMIYFMNTPETTDSRRIVGDMVFAIGCPKSLDKSISEGIISGIRDINGVEVIQTTAPISPGSSGGGLFSTDGKLIGITTYSMVGGQNLNFAIPIPKPLSEFTNEFNEIHANKSNQISYNQVDLEINMGNHQEAIALLQEIIRKNPSEFKAWVVLGQEYGKVKRHVDAFRAFQQAFKLQPDNIALLNALVHLGVSSADKNTRMYYFNILNEKDYIKAQSIKKDFSPYFD